MKEKVAVLTESFKPERRRGLRPSRVWAGMPREIVAAVAGGLLLEVINELVRILG